MGSRAVLLLVVRACALDFPSHFLRDADVAVEQLVDYDANAEFLEISSATGLPLHRYDASFGAHPTTPSWRCRRPAAYRQRGFHFGGADLPAAGPIGYAVDGVPIFPYSTAPARTRGAYVYRIAPPCLYGDDRWAYGSPRRCAPRLRRRGRARRDRGGAGARRPGAVPSSASWSTASSGGPSTKTGTSTAGSASRGGKYDGRGRYAYYATAAPPYTIACFGPGVAAAAGLPPTPPASPGAGAVDAGPDCPLAPRRGGRGAPARGRYALETPAGRAAYAAGSPARHCGGSCGLGAYCPRHAAPDAAVPVRGPLRRRAGPRDRGLRGALPRGHFCPPGTVAPRARAAAPGLPAHVRSGASRRVGLRLGRPRRGRVLPAGSAAPTRVRPGHYTVGASTLERGNASDADADARVAEVACEPGHYCVLGVKTPCPPGSYGASSGLADVACDGPCAPGYYCERGSATPTQNACGSPAVYCPAGSAAPLPVGAGNYSAAATAGYAAARGDAPGVAPSAAAAGTDAADARGGQRPCEPGYFCAGGVRRPCPAGTYGSAFGETSATCAGLCPPGMFCVEASTEAKPVANGAGQESDIPNFKGSFLGRWPTAPALLRRAPRRRDGPLGAHGDADVVDVVRLVANEATPRHLHGAPGEVYDVDGWHQHDRHAPRCERLYCPAVSARPLNVTAGRYAVGGNRTTRSAVADCAGLSSHGATLRLGLDRAPYCPTTLRDEDARDRRRRASAGNVGERALQD
ncbi:hypothetical protein JL722_11488 [Aureococcus anophagefferens]|nr:hypothetical protein JL722_11488 [Aureococcus anophagefferens]